MGGRILILMCDSGGGHRSVADAIAGALESLFPGKYQVELADIMADGFSYPLNLAGRLYGPVVNRLPRAWGLLWHLTNGRRRSPVLLRMLSPLGAARIKRLLLSGRPDLIISTHPWANHIPARLLANLGWKVPLVTVVTDIVSIHHWWLCPDVDLCLVPTKQVRQVALATGFAPEKLKVVGMPVDLKFVDRSLPRAQLRRELGLVEHRFTVLLAGGGEGMGNVFAIARSVAQVSLDLQLLIVTGRNEELRARLEGVSWDVPTRVMGFTDNMPALMHAADLLITKAGPSTICEALACGLPMLISGSLRGQEEGNAEWVVERGAGLLTPTPQEVVGALRELLRPGKDTLPLMAESARQAAKPDAALETARRINDLLGMTN
ncbi:MAG: galactosyldiacylglycerol synthase [Chloroflexi bacterium B3_Chlor]|nr:MAG: galactosyldiacylglycerol synthase [Chloroflexi bacterium B3_Chlor]